MDYPPRIRASEQARLVEVIKDWTIAHGLAVRPPASFISADIDTEAVLATHVPVTLFPSPFPRVCFEQAQAVQKTYNELYARISLDEEFLGAVIKEVAPSDEFIANLWFVHQRVKREGYVQKLSLGLFRSDYMVHQGHGDGVAPTIKQVEFNTIASSFGGLSTRTAELHRFLADTEYPGLSGPMAKKTLDLPASVSTLKLAAGLVAAYKAYTSPDSQRERCIIFLVQGGERNVFDQRHLEYAVQAAASSQRIPIFRLPFSDILKQTTVDQASNRQLLYHPSTNSAAVFEVAVVYMRSGYGPGDYPDDNAWEARYQIERSLAIKCPTVLTQLAGTKKVQQVLATPHTAPTANLDSPTGLSSYHLDHYIPKSSPTFESLWSTFTNIYPMDDSPAGMEARKLALDAEACKRFVLKPQREGGGNNIYKSAIPPFLKSLAETNWKSYILMELITPPPVSNLILRNGKLEEGGVICELGVYGTCLWDSQSEKILYNEQAGYLLRTKGDQSEEGGVAAGFGCMDSCCLV